MMSFEQCVEELSYKSLDKTEILIHKWAKEGKLNRKTFWKLINWYFQG